jgi:ATP-dependent DNA helicase RecG
MVKERSPRLLKTIFDRLEKPINFAYRDSFSHISQIRDLQNFIEHQVSAALSETQEPWLRKRLFQFRMLFEDFRTLPARDRQIRLVKARQYLTDMEKRSKQIPDRCPSYPSFSWERPVQYLKGVGPRRASLFERLRIKTVEDLLYFLPWRYEDRSHLCSVRELEPDLHQTTYGIIQSARLVVTRRKRFQIVEVMVGDDTGSVIAKWFNQPYLLKLLKPGQYVMLSGKTKVDRSPRQKLVLENPVYELLEDGEEVSAASGLHTGRIVPVYHETRGLSSRQIRSLIWQMLNDYADEISERLPGSIRQAYRFPTLSESLENVHFPMRETDLEILSHARTLAHQRLIFEEFLILQLGLGLRRRGVISEEKGVAAHADGDLYRRFLKCLPYQLTQAQKRVLEEIKADMTGSHPMNRLLQGDVGCGKTIVAVAAMTIAVDNGYQAALMAPTEILAEQHYLTVKRLMEPLGISVTMVAQGLSKRIRRTVEKQVADGKARLVIGTHALIQEGMKFNKLGLVVVDEQHKFGVMQRASLTKKGYHPDVLVMTATPIPRTLALSVYGDLDVSVIDEMPKGRGPIQTMLYLEYQRSQAYGLIREQIVRGAQAYVIYPLVDESEKIDLKAAVKMAKHLQRDVFVDQNVGLLHGQLKTEEKERVMNAFKERKIHILVATTVVEVGLDISNATVMLIEHADRYGLTQLHQLRGRVGRGPHPSYCLLMADSSGSKGLTEEAQKRLSILVQNQNGFTIAEEDLRQRGPGEFFGTRQSGLPELQVASIVRDAIWLEKARSVAVRILKEDPFLKNREHVGLKNAVYRKWKDRLSLSSVG